MRRLRLEDDSAFVTAAGMVIGFREGTGALRIIASDPDGKQRAIELPEKWLRGPGGLVAFIKSKGTNQEADA